MRQEICSHTFIDWSWDGPGIDSQLWRHNKEKNTDPQVHCLLQKNLSFEENFVSAMLLNSSQVEKLHTNYFYVTDN